MNTVRPCYMLIPAVILLIVTGMAVSASAAEPPVLSEVISDLQNHYDSLDDLRADFLHQAPVALTGTTLTEKGVFYYKKPSRLRWEYTDPAGKLMVVNPEVTWIYLPNDNRVYRQKTEEALASQMVVRFLTGMGQLEEDFSLSFADPSRDDDGNYHIELKPREYLGGIDSLGLIIDSNTSFLAGYTITDPYGTTSTYTFTDPVINDGLPETLFFDDPPSGAPVEDLP